MTPVTTFPAQSQAMPKTSESQAVARQSAVVEGEIVDAQSFNTRVAEWHQQGFSVLTPVVSLSTIPRDHRIVVNRVSVNPNPAGGEVYANPLFCGAGEVALLKVGLEKIAQCAGISIDESRRTDSGTVPHVWSYLARGHWIGFDGNRIDRIANKTLDLRDGSPDIKGFKPNQVEQARRHGEAVCESKAINRLYRMYGLRQKYTQKELADRPFIVLKLQWEPDMKNPIVAALVTQMKLGSTSLLYPQALGPAAVDPASLPAHQVPPEMRPAGKVQEEPDDDDVPFELPKKAAAQGTPPTRQEYFVTKVMQRKEGGFYITTRETGDARFLTDNVQHATTAKEANEAGSLVHLELDSRLDGVWIKSIAEVEKL